VSGKAEKTYDLSMTGRTYVSDRNLIPLTDTYKLLQMTSSVLSQFTAVCITTIHILHLCRITSLYSIKDNEGSMLVSAHASTVYAL
jgi:hypothetical protein